MPHFPQDQEDMIMFLSDSLIEEDHRIHIQFHSIIESIDSNWLVWKTEMMRTEGLVADFPVK